MCALFLLQNRTKLIGYSLGGEHNFNMDTLEYTDILCENKGHMVSQTIFIEFVFFDFEKPI